MSGPGSRDIRVVRAGSPKLESTRSPTPSHAIIILEKKNSLSNFREVSSLVFANSFQTRSFPTRGIAKNATYFSK